MTHAYVHVTALEKMLQERCHEHEAQRWCERGKVLPMYSCTRAAGQGWCLRTTRTGSALSPKLSSVNSVSRQLKQTKEQTVFYRKLSSVVLASAMQKIINKWTLYQNTSLNQPTSKSTFINFNYEIVYPAQCKKLLISERERDFFQPCK